MQQPNSTRKPRYAAWLVVSAAGFACEAQAQLIDAGGQANLMHQHQLMRQQSGADHDTGGTDASTKTNARTMEAELRQLAERRRRALYPEYQRRLQADGRESADAWLRRAAADAGRRDGLRVRAKYAKAKTRR